MSIARTKSLSFVIAGVLMGVAGSASADIVITEIDPAGSGANYGSDWFELTNTSTTTAVSIAGWSAVDNHADNGSTISIGNLTKGNATFGPALLTLANGQTSLAAGQSAIFLEGSASATSSAAAASIASFESAWFGGKLPAGLSVGIYDDGTNYGLSQTADEVNIFSGSTANSSLVANVAFGADSGSPLATFDNAAGLNNTTLTQKSVVGVNGAFLAATSGEIGSPGTIGAVPLPGTALLMLSGLGLFGAAAGRKKLKAPMVKAPLATV